MSEATFEASTKRNASSGVSWVVTGCPVSTARRTKSSTTNPVRSAGVTRMAASAASQTGRRRAERNLAATARTAWAAVAGYP